MQINSMDSVLTQFRVERRFLIRVELSVNGIYCHLPFLPNLLGTRNSLLEHENRHQVVAEPFKDNW